MVKLSYLLKPKYALFRDHDLRLRDDPRPELARRLFKERLREARRTQKIRLACFVGIYSSVVLGVASVLFGLFGNAPLIESALGAISGIASSLTLVFVAGAFLATRALSYLEVDLYFYSQEGRAPERRSALVEPARTAPMRRRGPRRIYTTPPARVSPGPGR